MSRFALSTFVAFAATSSVLAQVDPTVDTPLADKRIPYDAIPYQVDTQNGVRGSQSGFNICNSTTETQSSMCQTAVVNHIDDFCLWAPMSPDIIANTEGEEVAWCTKPGHGTRLVPEGALKGVQVLKTSEYLQFVGFIDQTKININAGDSGGELDPHGADLRGNPLGGLIYSNAFASNGGNNDSYQQVIEWTNFMGGDQFSMKICDPAGAHDAEFCQHIYDRIGVAYNAPNAAKTGVFEVCDADLMDYPGVYTSNGQTFTYTQPAESLGAISTMPYEPRVPASSNCVQYQSADIYAAIASVTASAAASASASTTASGSAAAVTHAAASESSGKVGSASASRTGTASGAQSTTDNVSGAANVGASIVGLLGVMVAVVALL